MPTRKELILTRLTEEGAKTAAFFRTLPPKHWKQQVYMVGPEWGAHDILCHFISVERTLAIYYGDLAKGGTGVPRDFDIDAFNAREVKALRNANHTPESLIEQFEHQRQATVTLVQTLADSDFDRIGFHPWFGDTPLENMLKLVYRHTMLHIRDLNKAIDTGQPVPHVDITPPSKNS
jgi:hypothetical protein